MRGKRTDWRQVIGVVALAAIAIWLGTKIWGLASKAQLAWDQAHETKAQYEELEARRAKLTAELDDLNTVRGQDAAVREAFGVARPGEEVIVVVPPPPATTTPPTFWQRLWGWL